MYGKLICASLISGVHRLRGPQNVGYLLLRFIMILPEIPNPLYIFEIHNNLQNSSLRLLYQIKIFTIDISKDLYHNMSGRRNLTAFAFCAPLRYRITALIFDRRYQAAGDQQAFCRLLIYVCDLRDTDKSAGRKTQADKQQAQYAGKNFLFHHFYPSNRCLLCNDKLLSQKHYNCRIIVFFIFFSVLLKETRPFSNLLFFSAFRVRTAACPGILCAMSCGKYSFIATVAERALSYPS